MTAFQLYTPHSFLWLAGIAVLGSLTIRLLVSGLHASTKPRIQAATEFFRRFTGTYDYWHTFILGAIELFAYSMLLASGLPEYAGAWIALKAVAQWERWHSNRDVFNIFLIGNASILAVSYAVSRCPTIFPLPAL
jgi:hypothetical protein